MKLVADVYNGPGPASTYEAADAWRALSAGLAAADTEFADAMKLARGNWEGPAADAAQAALAPFSEWATTAEAIANALSAEAAFNAGAFSTTKAAMPSPTEVAAVAAVKDNPVDKVVGLLTGVPTPAEVAESVAAAQQAEAAIAMTGYDASTGLVDSYLALRPPPHLTTGVISSATVAGNTASYGDFGNGASQLYAAAVSAGGVSAGGVSAGGVYHPAGGSVDGSAGSGGHSSTGGPSGSGGTHAAGTGGSTAGPADGVGGGSGGSGGSGSGGVAAGSRSGSSQSIAAAAGLGAGAGALGLGSSRTFSGPEALGRSTGGFGGTGSVSGSGGMGSASGSGGTSSASGSGGSSASGAGGARAAGLGGTGSSAGGVSGSAATAAEGSARGPLSAGSTSAVAAPREALGARGVGGAAGSSATGGRGGAGLGAGAGAGRSNGQDDDEHEIPDYLKDLEHFTDGRVVAPPVIGADDTW